MRLIQIRPVCRSCGAQLVAHHKHDPAYHWEWCTSKLLYGRQGRGNTATPEMRQG